MSSPSAPKASDLDCTIQTLSEVPTHEVYGELLDAHEFFNKGLFDGKLPDCIYTLQRKARSYGYFSCNRFANGRGVVRHEIALNPSFFFSRTERGVLSTLVHEQAHLWQQEFGVPGRGGYHNRQWANQMIAIGLYPSSTGEPNGRELGDRMSHYIVDGGAFDLACSDLLKSGFQLSWLETTALSRQQPPTTSRAVKGTTGNRWKYTCPLCKFNAWAKPNATVICGECSSLQVMIQNCCR